VIDTLVALGRTHRELVPYRLAVLTTLREAVAFDAAIFHAFSPRVSVESAAIIGFTADVLAATQGGWDQVAVELGALRELANRRGAAADREAYPAGSKGRARFLEYVVRPFGMRRMAMVHLTVRGEVRSAIALLSRHDDAFDDAALEVLRRASGVIALADSLLVLETAAPRAASPVALRCEDGRLTPRQRTIVEHVALGHTNDQIAKALTISPNTLRNQLAEVFRRLGASNRADVVRLAVLTPS
jgi:DNA-binding CsgD family transcriptional regulator